MSIVDPPSPKPGEELDDLLRAFFRLQMPAPWPKSSLPLASTRSSSLPLSNGGGLIRSRWALAASAAVLLAGSFLMPRSVPQQTKAENGLSGAPAISNNPFPRQMNREHNKQPHHNKPDNDVEDEGHLPEMDESDLPFLK